MMVWSKKRVLEFQLAASLRLSLNSMRPVVPSWSSISAVPLLWASSTNRERSWRPANLGWQNRTVLAVSEVAPTIAVVLRSPFDLSSYPEIQTYLCTYSILRPSLDALADVLAGIAEASGRLPSPIGDLFPTGHGLGQATVRR